MNPDALRVCPEQTLEFGSQQRIVAFESVEQSPALTGVEVGRLFEQ